MRLVNVLGTMTVTLVIVWSTDFSPLEWFRHWRAHQPKPVTVAPIPSTTSLVVAPPAPKGNDTSLSKVPLPLLLVNVSPGRTSHEGTAQIGVYRDSPQTLQAGALLENGARLIELFHDHVVLEKDGRKVRLFLSNTVQGSHPESPLLTVGGATSASTAPITSREIITDYVRPNPVYSGDTLLGFQVYPGSKPGPFHQMGLKPGDVITEIAGTPVVDPQSAWTLLHQLGTGELLSVSVKRGEATQEITLDGSVIVTAEEAPPPEPPQPMQGSNGQ